MSDPVLAALIGAGGVVVASLVHLIDRTIGKNIAHLRDHLTALESKVDALFDRFDSKLDALFGRLDSRIHDLLQAQVDLRERLGRLEAREDGSPSQGTHPRPRARA